MPGVDSTMSTEEFYQPSSLLGEADELQLQHPSQHSRECLHWTAEQWCSWVAVVLAVDIAQSYYNGAHTSPVTLVTAAPWEVAAVSVQLSHGRGLGSVSLLLSVEWIFHTLERGGDTDLGL